MQVSRLTVTTGQRRRLRVRVQRHAVGYRADGDAVLAAAPEALARIDDGQHLGIALAHVAGLRLRNGQLVVILGQLPREWCRHRHAPVSWPRDRKYTCADAGRQCRYFWSLKDAANARNAALPPSSSRATGRRRTGRSTRCTRCTGTAAVGVRQRHLAAEPRRHPGPARAAPAVRLPAGLDPALRDARHEAVRLREVEHLGASASPRSP
jgi:hypothetical protein